jgi:hypothetical protein
MPPAPAARDARRATPDGTEFRTKVLKSTFHRQIRRE